MKNKFYNEFDTERVAKSKRKNDYRTPFQIDRDRIIHSSEFRRLQAKTQVFLSGEFDFYRTRLTHSIEVAQIGRSICNYLIHCKDSPFTENYYIDPDIVESACLAHDLGHPPFGHAGERTLNKLMRNFGGFEGNAQTLRLITEIFYRDGESRRGMNPTRAFLDSVLKYKKIFGRQDTSDNQFIYNYQKKYLEFVFAGKDITREFMQNKNPNDFRSIECQIMDWADDTAYAINDIVDSISGGFLTIDRLDKWLIDNNDQLNSKQIEYVEEIIEWIKTAQFKAKFGSLIGDSIRACSIGEKQTFMKDLTNRYKFNLTIEPYVIEKVNLYKRISVELVFNSTQLHQMELKGDLMITKLFRVLEENYISALKENNILPDFTDKLVRQESDKLKRARLICDTIASMTDAYAMRTYKRLFDPEYSSLGDII